MNKNYSQIDQMLDEIILGKAGKEKWVEHISEADREELSNELHVHQVAASVVQRSAVYAQVSRVHHEFLENRNGFTSENARYTRAISITRNMKFWWSAAAVLIIAPLLIMFFVYATNTPARLFASQYQTYRINVERSSGGQNALPLIKHYQQTQYDQVVKDYANLKSPGVREKVITAFAHMELQQYDAAVSLLDAVVRSNVLTGDKLYQDEAEYYLALGLLKSNRTEDAYLLFNKIYADDEHTFNGRVDKWFIIRLKWLL